MRLVTLGHAAFFGVGAYAAWGAGRRYGAFLGAPLYLFMQDYLAREDPANWYLWIGLMLLAIVFLAPGGLTAWVGALAQRVAGRRS